MAKKKRLTPEQELQLHRKELLESMEQWGELKMNGGNDPSWPDGTNMNLVRKHISWHKFKIMEVCMILNIPCPPEYYLKEPPEVPEGYMANLDQTERVERLKQMGFELTTEMLTPR